MGDTPFGPFSGVNAFFVYDSETEALSLLIYDESVDLALIDSNDPSIYFIGLSTERACVDWIGDSSTLGYVYKGQYDIVNAELTVAGKLGSWNVADPDDPPRLYGDIVGLGDGVMLAGPFDAVYCDLFGG